MSKGKEAADPKSEKGNHGGGGEGGRAGNQHRGEGLFLFPSPFGGCAESVRIEAGEKGKQLGKDKEGRAGGISRP